MADEYITGLDKLTDNLSQGSARAAKNFLRRIERKAAQPILEAQQEHVPVRDGDLLEGLTISSTSDDHSVTTAIGPEKDENFIGRFTEFGTVDQPAQHWMDAAFRESAQSALDIMTEELQDALKDMEQK